MFRNYQIANGSTFHYQHMGEDETVRVKHIELFGCSDGDEDNTGIDVYATYTVTSSHRTTETTACVTDLVRNLAKVDAFQDNTAPDCEI